MGTCPSASVFVLLLVLLVSISLTSVMAAAEPTLSRKEHLDAKRAFDRVKQHPVTDGDGPLIEYKAADGTMKTMTQADLQQRLQQQDAVLPQLNEDGSTLTKSEEGKATLEELKTKDPYLSRMVEASQFALHRLQADGALDKEMRLKSLHTVEEEGPEGTSTLDADHIKLHLRLVVEDETMHQEEVEVLLEGGDGHGALTHAWRLVGEDKVAIALSFPEASPPASSWGWLSVLTGVINGERVLLTGREWSPGMVWMLGGGFVCVAVGLTLVVTSAVGKKSGRGASRKGD
ncbi:hypothetical protein Naga_100093g17 [Nannochloropsis gaditana]|uniref:Transmembrane protein n=1 Tax=Nannochloropsis gaditana TaxID=72520 RepID=W7TRZ5_9STRA|nr:hypothetical protein Naga_100093g17 [Nannochloropsis gaditana]